MFTNCHTHYSNKLDFEVKQEELNCLKSCFHSIGIHPWNSVEFDEKEVKEILKKSINEKTVAIGECGLDGLKGPDFLIQTPIFEKQIELSEELCLPLIIHCVKGWNELAVLKKKHNPQQSWVFHGFSKFGILNQVISSGMMISLGAGIINHQKRKEMVEQIPIHQLLLETDDVKIEIKEIYEVVAELKKISLHELQNQVNTNFKNTFTKWQIG
jgi:TatD DNase family protein